jgi:hypothetical protein
MKVLYNKLVNLKQPVHKALESVIVKNGAVKAVEEYRKMKADTAHYYVDWLAMNQLGDQLFALKRYEDARIIFENNALEFPERGLSAVEFSKNVRRIGSERRCHCLLQKGIGR